MVLSLFRSSKTEERARELYADIVSQSRNPVFYEQFGVPDTVEGRFDLISMHMFLVVRRLKTASEESAKMAQKLTETMFRNMDHSLREMGVGDLSIPKKVRAMAEAYFGRVLAYENALEETDEALAKALARNVYGDEDLAASSSRLLASYVIRAEEQLSSQSCSRLHLGLVSFPDPQIFAASIGDA